MVHPEGFESYSSLQSPYCASSFLHGIIGILANRTFQMHYNKNRYATDRKVADNIPESWLCIDCGVNTAPGFLDGPTVRREAALKSKAENSLGMDAEVYSVRDKIWKKAGMEPWGGCLCIGCLEKRLGRKLTHKDFDPSSPFEQVPMCAKGTERLLDRRRNHEWEPPGKFSWNDE